MHLRGRSLDALVDDDAERVLRHVVHDAGAAVVALVRHALLHRAVTLHHRTAHNQHQLYHGLIPVQS